MFYHPSIEDPNTAWKSYININRSVEDVVEELKTIKNNTIENRIDYSDYLLQNNDLVKQTNFLLERNLDNFDRIIYNQNETLYSLDVLNFNVNETNEKIIELTQIIKYNLSAIIEQQKISNFLLNHIAYLISIPDIEKEKVRNLELGLKHFKNARINSELFNDAKTFLLKAKEIDYTDYITLYYLGMVYLYGNDCINLDEAIFHFTEAGKYAEVDSYENVSKLLFLLKYSTNNDIQEKIPSSEYLKKFAAESFYQASIAAYTKKDYSLSKSLASKAITLFPKLHNAHILYCRAMLKDDDTFSAIEYLSEYLFKNPIIYDIICADPVFFENAQMVYFLIKIKKDFRTKTLHILEKLIKLTNGSLVAERVNNSTWIKILLDCYALFLEETFEKIVKSYTLVRKIEIQHLNLSQKFDVLEMCPNKRLIPYASSRKSKHIILAIGCYIIIYIDGKYFKSFSSNNYLVSDIYITNNNKYFITVGMDSILEVYDLNTYVLKKVINLDYNITRLCVSNDMKKIALYGNGKIILFDFDFDTFSYKQTVICEGINSFMSNLSFSNNSKYLAFCKVGGKEIVIYDTINHTVFKEIKIQSDTLFLLRAIQFSQNDEFIALSGDDGIIAICELNNLNLNILRGPKHIITKLFFNEDNTFIVSDSNEEIIVWNIKNKKVHRRIVGINNFIYGINKNVLEYTHLDVFENCDSNLEKFINYEMTYIKNGIIKYS